MCWLAGGPSWSECWSCVTVVTRWGGTQLTADWCTTAHTGPMMMTGGLHRLSELLIGCLDLLQFMRAEPSIGLLEKTVHSPFLLPPWSLLLLYPSWLPLLPWNHFTTLTSHSGKFCISRVDPDLAFLGRVPCLCS